MKYIIHHKNGRQEVFECEVNARWAYKWCNWETKDATLWVMDKHGKLTQLD